MLMNEIKTGEIFCMEGAKSFPKMKLDSGYIDMRHKFKNIINLDFICDLMSEGAVAEEFRKYGMNSKDIENLKKDLLKRFN